MEEGVVRMAIVAAGEDAIHLRTALDLHRHVARHQWWRDARRQGDLFVERAGDPHDAVLIPPTGALLRCQVNGLGDEGARLAPIGRVR